MKRKLTTLRAFPLQQAQWTRCKEYEDEKVEEEQQVIQPGQQSLTERGRWKITVMQSFACLPCPTTYKRLTINMKSELIKTRNPEHSSQVQ